MFFRQWRNLNLDTPCVTVVFTVATPLICLSSTLLDDSSVCWHLALVLYYMWGWCPRIIIMRLLCCSHEAHIPRIFSADQYLCEHHISENIYMLIAKPRHLKKCSLFQLFVTKSVFLLMHKCLFDL